MDFGMIQIDWATFLSRLGRTRDDVEGSCARRDWGRPDGEVVKMQLDHSFQLVTRETNELAVDPVVADCNPSVVRSTDVMPIRVGQLLTAANRIQYIWRLGLRPRECRPCLSTIISNHVF